MDYQRLLRLGKGVASRGKMMGLTFGEGAAERAKQVNQHILRLKPLADPLLQDMNVADRSYLSYSKSILFRAKIMVLIEIRCHSR